MFARVHGFGSNPCTRPPGPTRSARRAVKKPRSAPASTTTPPAGTRASTAAREVFRSSRPRAHVSRASTRVIAESPSGAVSRCPCISLDQRMATLELDEDLEATLAQLAERPTGDIHIDHPSLIPALFMSERVHRLVPDG